jgi:hypothetical protein
MTEFGIALTFFVFSVVVIVWVVADIYRETQRTLDDLDFYSKENNRDE